MIETNDSDILLADLAAFTKANTSGGNSLLPKPLQKHFDALLAQYEKAISLEGREQLQNRAILQDVKRMVRGERPLFIEDERIIK